MKLKLLLAAGCCAGLLTLPARADEGHDHGTTAPIASSTALPRFAAVSELFELVGVLSGRQLTLYLDRSADNSPVPGAQIELDIGGQAFKAQAAADAVYEVQLPTAPAAGVLAITVTVTAGAETDLLAGELDVHGAAHHDEAAHGRTWKTYAWWASGGLLALAALGWSARRAVRARGAA